MTDEFDLILEPEGDYALLDFGGGRRLERWGEYLVDRPDRAARGRPARERWTPDWQFVGDQKGGHWRAARPGLPRQWRVRLGDFHVRVALGPHGSVGVKPRALLAAAWARARLEGCYHLDEIRVLNLFAGSGLVTRACVAAGADVVHVDGSERLIALAREEVHSPQVEWVHEDAMTWVEGALRRGERFDLLMLSPPYFGRGPHGKVWDTECDMAHLMKKLPALVSETCRGIWLGGDEEGWSAASLARLLRDALPGRTLETHHLAIRCADGRLLASGVAACWFDESDDAWMGADRPPLDAARMEERLDVPLDPVLSSRRTAGGIARELAGFEREQQEFVLHWVNVIAHTNAEMAYQFAAASPRALRLMDRDGVEGWLIAAMDAYDRTGLYAGIEALQKVEEYAALQARRQSGLALEKVVNVLEAFVHGLNGRRLAIEAGEVPWTDTETLYLPPLLDRYPERETNFRLYEAMALHLWAQTWYGTWREDPAARADQSPWPERYLRLFHALETARLDACIARDLPGMAREMAALRAGHAWPAAWAGALADVARPGATVETVHDWLPRLLELDETPAPLPYQGELRPQEVARVRAARIEADRRRFRLMLLRMEEELRRRLEQARGETEPREAGETPPRNPLERFELKRPDEAVPPEDLVDAWEITLDGKPIPPPEEARAVMASILQDLGEIPDTYLHAAGEGPYDPDLELPQPSPEDVWKGAYHEEGAFHYNEWDYERQHYRKHWAVLRELDVQPVHDGFVEETVRRYSGVVKHLRRTFEALRGEDRLLKKQPHGDDIDLDAVVEAWADSHAGMEMSDRLFTKMHKLERNIAVLFMVDMSGSTKGWINDAEREALVLLCEALETLGDRYAIYGFSGTTRKRCEVYRIKRFDEPYDEAVRARISGIRPRDYTRMGVAIRHLSRLLAEVEAKTRLLITLSDGKPDDLDNYRGAYGIEDTRMALIEAKREGIHPYCITIDTEAMDYLPHMYGPVNYTVIDEVRKLPLKVSDIYRRLTT
ncbi:MAG: nitric oxide reductase activation protein [Gammaproteobacteria bacterium]|nr:MAG: nitric oxide reductase activation protein [Gammaproteobacteria bacterium]